MKSLDTRSLRQAIRFIHCIQRERGSACAIAAALQSSQIRFSIEERLRPSQEYENNEHVPLTKTQRDYNVMIQVLRCARHKTDLALADIMNSPSSTTSLRKIGASFRTSITRIRSMVTCNSLKHYDSKLPHIVYKNSSCGNNRRIVMAFNALVVHIIHEIFVLNSFNHNLSSCTANPKFINGNRDRAVSSPLRAKYKNIMDARTLNDGTNLSSISGIDKQGHIPSGILSKSKRMRMVASADGNFYNQIFQSVNENMENLQIEYREKRLPSQHTKSSPFGKPPLPKSYNEKSTSKRNETRSKALLSLLLSLVQLKESTSIERAFLTSLLSMSEISQTQKERLEETEGADDVKLLTEIKIAEHMPLRRIRLSDDEEKLFNDLVMELENQRWMIKKLRKKAREVEDNDKKEGYRWSISALVEQSVQISPELSELHNLIQQNFDSQAFSKVTKHFSVFVFLQFFLAIDSCFFCFNFVTNYSICAGTCVEFSLSQWKIFGPRSQILPIVYMLLNF